MTLVSLFMHISPLHFTLMFYLYLYHDTRESQLNNLKKKLKTSKNEKNGMTQKKEKKNGKGKEYHDVVKQIFKGDKVYLQVYILLIGLYLKALGCINGPVFL